MNYEEINAFVTMQMQELEKTGGGKGDGMVLLAMADYLLEQLQQEPGIFQQEDLVSLRKSFLRVGNLSEKIMGFYDRYGGPLKEASVKIMERIGKNMSALEEQSKRIQEMEEEKILDLERAKEAEKKVQALEQEKQEILHKQNILKKQAEHSQEELKRLIKENADFEKETEKISALLVEAETVNQELQAYFSENESLKRSILEEGYEDKEGFVRKLQEMKKQSENLMSSYDKILKSMLEDGERLQKKIKERQRNH